MRPQVEPQSRYWYIEVSNRQDRALIHSSERGELTPELPEAVMLWYLLLCAFVEMTVQDGMRIEISIVGGKHSSLPAGDILLCLE